MSFLHSLLYNSDKNLKLLYMGSDFNVENRPKTLPLLKIDTFWRLFSTGASIFNDRMVLFFNKFQLKASHFSMGSIFNVTPAENAERFAEPLNYFVFIDISAFTPYFAFGCFVYCFFLWTEWPYRAKTVSTLIAL